MPQTKEIPECFQINYLLSHNLSEINMLFPQLYFKSIRNILKYKNAYYINSFQFWQDIFICS